MDLVQNHPIRSSRKFSIRRPKVVGQLKINMGEARFAQHPPGLFDAAHPVIYRKVRVTPDALAARRHLKDWAAGQQLSVAHLDTIAKAYGVQDTSLGKMSAYPLMLGLGSLSQIPTRLDDQAPREVILQRWLSQYRGRRAELIQRLMYAYVDDWKKDSLYRAFTFDGILQLIEGRAWLGRRTGLAMQVDDPWSQMGVIGSGHVKMRKLHAVNILDDPKASFCVVPGGAENSLGLEFRLSLPGQEGVLAKVGIEYTRQGIHIINIQGGVRKGEGVQAFRAQTGVHPFDWLIMAIVLHAQRAGFASVRGYGYQWNASIVHHLKVGDVPLTGDDFARTYNARFKMLGFQSAKDLDNTYDLPLAVENTEILFARLRRKGGALVDATIDSIATAVAGFTTLDQPMREP